MFNYLPKLGWLCYTWTGSAVTSRALILALSPKPKVMVRCKMSAIASFILLTCALFLNGSVINGKRGQRQMSAVDEETYNTLTSLTKGDFYVPVKERSLAQKAACIRFWRAKERFIIRKVNGLEKLYFNGKEVLKKTELKSLVEKEFKHCKGAGSRKLNYRLNKRFEGVSERKIQAVLSKSRLNQKMNARFQNKAIIRPIRAKAIQVRSLLV